LYLFGTAISTLTVISFIQREFGVPLIPIYSHGLSICREFLDGIATALYAPFVLLAEQIASWLQIPLRISIPDWWKDLATLSTLNAAANLRGSMVMRGRQLSFVQTLGYLAAIWIYGVTLLGLVLFAIPFLSISLLMPPNDREDRALNRLLWRVWAPYLLSLFAVAVAAAAFFVVNAYGL
jgi:hypothetical protein